jgi:hypothetical protein
MSKRTIFGGTILIVFLLILSSGFSAAFNLSNEDNNLVDNNKSFVDTEEQTLDAKMLLKNLFFGREKKSDVQLPFFTSTITTTCDDIEKTSEITFGLLNELDVDNDQNTGIDGKDIRVQYLILPYFLPSPEFTLGAVFSVTVERIGNEIKDSSFSLSASIADNLISLGYTSSNDTINGIPKRIQLSSTIFIEPMADTIGFSFYMNPNYEANQQDKKITLFASFNDSDIERTYSFGFEPAVETQITLRSTKNPEKWQYSLTRNSPFDTIFTAEIDRIVNGVSEETKLTIDSLPEEIVFSLALTPFSSEGGSIEYESSTMYDVSVIFETAELGQCKYAIIKNTPRELIANWIPSRENGFYHIDIDSEGTSVYLLNSLQSPSINLSIQDISTINMNAFWNLTNPGDLKVIKDPSLTVDLDIIFDDWQAELDAKPTAEYIYCSWKSNVSGFFTLDTKQDPLSNIDLLVKGPENGVRLIGETLAADDFFLEWTAWPISEFNINKSGSIDWFTLSIEIFLNDNWYKIWPWF